MGLNFLDTFTWKIVQVGGISGVRCSPPVMMDNRLIMFPCISTKMKDFANVYQCKPKKTHSELCFEKMNFVGEFPMGRGFRYTRKRLIITE